MTKSELKNKWYQENKEKVKEYQRKYNEKNKEFIKELRKNYRLNNKEKFKEYSKKSRLKHKDSINQRKREEYHKNKEKKKNEFLKYLYKINLDQYNQMLRNQNYKCAICQKHQSELNKSLSVDHDHINGNIRGLLCNSCNLAIGYLKENIESCLQAAEYLKRYK